MSAHVKVWRGGWARVRWCWTCHRAQDCPGFEDGYGLDHPTHAEALAAAWAHIKEHS